MCAAYEGHRDVAKFLVRHKTNLDHASSHDGYTASYWAVSQNHVEVVIFLFASGISVREADQTWPLLELAANRGQEEETVKRSVQIR